MERMKVKVPAGEKVLDGDLTRPDEPIGVVLFAHGSGSSRHSPRNRFVAEALNEARLATLLLDLLTRDEEEQDLQTGHLRFDIALLADRLVTATEWLAENPTTASLPIGYFGASTGGGAALVAAARVPDRVLAVVSRGGRPDLAGPALPQVQAPTLLLVGGNDGPVIGMNREAERQMNAVREVRIIPGASHLFEEAGTLQQVAEHAADWFVRYIASPGE